MNKRSQVSFSTATAFEAPVPEVVSRASASRLPWPDVVRIVGICWVIGIHVSAVPLNQFNSIPRQWWWWANVYDGLSRAAVPVFIIVSGALLLGHKDFDLISFARKRLLKVGFPLIAWGLIYLGWRSLINGESFTFEQVLRALISGLSTPAYPHLWFLYLIISLYLVAPVINVFIVNGTKRVQFYFLALWAFATFLQPLLEEFFQIKIGINLGPVVGYVGYFALGAIIEKNIPVKLPGFIKPILIAIFGLGWLVAVVGTYHVTTLNNGKVDEYYLDTLAPNVALMSVAAYLLIREITYGNRIAQMANSMVPLVFGVYLVHAMVIDLVDRAGMHLDPIPHNPMWYVPLVLLTVFLISILITAIIRRVPFIRLLAP